MISSEVQRTLVKSPPELWAEVSDPESLARHLGEFGEIRITRVQPEQKVEWEADDASGTVVIKPSGWGTKVKLTVTRDVSLDAEPADRPDVESELEPALSAELEPALSAEAPEPQADENETVAQPEGSAFDADSVAEHEPAESIDDVDEHESVDAREIAPEPRRGFFARLFGRRRAPAAQPASSKCETAFVTTEDEPPAEPADEVPAPTDEGPVEGGEERPDEHETDAHEDTGETPANRDVAAELKAAEEVAAEQVTAVLTSVLDRLGAAHHRPFSRP